MCSPACAISGRRFGPPISRITRPTRALRTRRQRELQQACTESVPTCPELERALSLAHTRLVSLRVRSASAPTLLSRSSIRRTLMHTGISGNTLKYLQRERMSLILGAHTRRRGSHFAASDGLEPTLECGLGRLEVLCAEPTGLVDTQAVVAPLEGGALGRAAERDRDAALVRLAVLCPPGYERLVSDWGGPAGVRSESGTR